MVFGVFRVQCSGFSESQVLEWSNDMKDSEFENVGEAVDLPPAEVAATFSDITEVNTAAHATNQVAVSASPDIQDEEDDPLTLFSWSLKYRANSTFGNGQYEGRLILGSDLFIQSGDSVDELLKLMRDKAAKVVEKLES